MKNKVKEMEDEAEKLRQAQEEGGGEEGEEGETTAEEDSRSVYVGQVDYSATPEELQEHFAGCGTVNRVTILCDRFRNPKGYAYIEFAEPENVEAAVALNESEFKGRQLKITAKRTNVHGFGGKGKGKGGGKGGGKGFGKGKGYGKGKGGYKGYQPMWRPKQYGRGKGYRPY
jgi:polyadenylate-binding protein 2